MGDSIFETIREQGKETRLQMMSRSHSTNTQHCERFTAQDDDMRQTHCSSEGSRRGYSATKRYVGLSADASLK